MSNQYLVKLAKKEPKPSLNQKAMGTYSRSIVGEVVGGVGGALAGNLGGKAVAALSKGKIHQSTARYIGSGVGSSVGTVAGGFTGIKSGLKKHYKEASSVEILEKIAITIIDHATQKPINSLPVVGARAAKSSGGLMGKLLKNPLARGAALAGGAFMAGRMTKSDG